MAAPITLEQQVSLFFATLNRHGAKGTLPEPCALRDKFDQLIQKAKKKDHVVQIEPKVSSLFATAAVDMWHRSVHSFLVSAALTSASPIWSAICGYYASHYVVRGLAHLLGVFQLHRRKCVLHIEIQDGLHLCHIVKKEGSDREHKFYWKAVKQHPRFIDDPFFVLNREDIAASDSAHRNRANYADHINYIPTFQTLSKAVLRARIDQLSQMDLSSIPIPDVDKYPDNEAVQVVAYHRIVKFRGFVDDILGGSNRFWNVHRTPSWCSDILDFQVTSPRFLAAYASTS